MCTANLILTCSVTTKKKKGKKGTIAIHKKVKLFPMAVEFYSPVNLTKKKPQIQSNKQICDIFELLTCI